MSADDRKAVEERERYSKEDARNESGADPVSEIETHVPSYADDTGMTSLGVDEPVPPDDPVTKPRSRRREQPR